MMFMVYLIKKVVYLEKYIVIIKVKFCMVIIIFFYFYVFLKVDWILK